MYSSRRGMGAIQSDPTTLNNCEDYTPQFVSGWMGTPSGVWYFGGAAVAGPLDAPVGPIPTGPDGSAQPGGMVYPAYVSGGSCTAQFDYSSPQPNPFNQGAANAFQTSAAQAVSQPIQQAIANASTPSTPASPTSPASSTPASSSSPPSTPAGQTIINSSGATPFTSGTVESSGNWLTDSMIDSIPNWVLLAAAGAALLLFMGGSGGK